MKRVATLLSAATLLLGLSASSRADFPNDTRNPKEYSQEDSNPFKLISYVLAPIGFVLEWTVARPLHYLATDTKLAPVMSGDPDITYGSSPAPIAELPPIYSRATTSGPAAPGGSMLRGEDTTPLAGPSVAPSEGTQRAIPPAPSQSSGGQPILH